MTQTQDAVLFPLYNSLQQTRGFAHNAQLALAQYEPTTSLAKQAEMYFAIGFAEIQLGEDFCNGIPISYTVGGIPQYTSPLTDSAVFVSASAQLDSGLALAAGTDAASVQIKNALSIAKGRAQLDMGQFVNAAATVASVPVSFQYAGEYSQTTNDNGWWIMTTSSKRYSVGDSVDATGAYSRTRRRSCRRTTPAFRQPASATASTALRRISSRESGIATTRSRSSTAWTAS